MNPGKSEAYLNLGIVYMKYLKDYESALVYFNKSLATEPTQIRAYLCKGDLYKIMYNESYGVDPVDPSETENQAALPGEKIKKTKTKMDIYLDNAIRNYSKCIHLAPSNYLVYLYRGRLLLNQL